MKHLRTSLIFGTVLLCWGTLSLAADAVQDGIADLQHRWARAYYQVPKAQKETVFKELAEQAHHFTAANPGRAEPMVWEAIILSSYARFNGGLGALSMVKDARDLLERAEKLNPAVLDGSVYTSLGSLYYKVPRWPIGFGDKDKAREYLEKALSLNPSGIDANYFYGDFLMEQGEFARAHQYLEKALASPSRAGREDADQGRRAEIETDLEKLKHKS